MSVELEIIDLGDVGRLFLHTNEYGGVWGSTEPSLEESKRMAEILHCRYGKECCKDQLRDSPK